MIGFMLMLVFVVLGVLGLMAGLQFFGVVPRREGIPVEGPSREDLRRLEEALAALDARLERVEEQQRFLERLLEARPERPSLPGSAEQGGAESANGPESDVERGVDSVLFDVEREER